MVQTEEGALPEASVVGARASFLSLLGHCDNRFFCHAFVGTVLWAALGIFQK
jgi:hypothetical protein